MKKILLFGSLLILSATIHSQAVFQKAISIPFTQASAKSIIQTSDGGFLVGASGASNGSTLIKTDAQGTILWTKTYSSSTTMALMQAGECIGGGYFMFGTSSDSSTWAAGFSLTKVDVNGNVLWGKTIPTNTMGYGYSKVRCTADGGFVISESLYSKMGAIKLDANGNIVWQNSFSDDPNDQSPKCPSFNCLICNDGSMVFTGKRNSDVLLVKTNTTGSMAWSSTIGNGEYYHAYGITATADGGYVVGGYANFYPFLMKVNATGAMVWYHEFITTGGGEFDEVYEQPNGNLIAIGTDYSTTFITTFNSTGTMLASKEFASNAYSFAYYGPTMCLTSDGGYAFASDYNDINTGMSALVIMKTNSSGTLPCDFSTYSMTENPTTSSAVVMSVPIYSHASSEVVTTLTSNAISLNATEVDYCVLFSTNSQVAEAASISVFPSPLAAGENIHLEIKNAAASSVAVYDANGRVVRTLDTAPVLNSTLEISTADLSPGIYFIRVSGADQSLLGTSKFIIR
jgi:hypothetical protein